MKTVQVERAQLEQWLQAFKKIHDDKHSHWDVDEEISAIEKALEPIAMDVMKSDEADFWRWWKPYQLKDCWRLELVARDAWMASKAALKPKEPEQSDVVSGKTFDRIVALNESNAARVLELEEKLEALAQPEQEKERCVGCEAYIDTACGRDECPKGWPKAAQPAVTESHEQEPVAWVPYLSDRADGVKGRYAIARWNPRGYREVWNLRRHEWGAYSDDVLSLEEADTLLRLITIPTRKVTSPQPPQPKEPEQEPVAVLFDDGSIVKCEDLEFVPEKSGQRVQMLYLTPPQRTWVGLTDREKSNLWLESRVAIPRFHTYASLVEAKLKAKNERLEKNT